MSMMLIPRDPDASLDHPFFAKCTKCGVQWSSRGAYTTYCLYCASDGALRPCQVKAHKWVPRGTSADCTEEACSMCGLIRPVKEEP